MLFYPISALINAVTSTIVGIIAITRNPRSRLHRSFSYFAFSVALWSYCYLLWQISSNADAALFWCRALMAFAIFIPSTFFHFSVIIIRERERYLKQIVFWYCASVVFLIFDLTPLFVRDVRPQMGFPFWPTAGMAYAPFLAMFIGLTTYSHALMFKHWKTFSGTLRNQITFVSLGTAIGFLGGTTNYPLWYGIKILPVGNVLVSVYVFLVFYAIIRHRLMDIRIVVTRAGILAVVYTLVLGIPFYIGYSTKSWLLTAASMFLFASVGPLVFTRLRTSAESIILSKQREYQSALLHASQGMTLVKELNKLLELIVRMVSKAVKVRYVYLYLIHNETGHYTLQAKRSTGETEPLKEIAPDSLLVKWLKDNRKPFLYDEAEASAYRASHASSPEIALLSGSLIIPSFIQDNLIGFLVVGNKVFRRCIQQ